MIDFTKTYERHKEYIDTAFVALILTIIGKFFITDPLIRDEAMSCGIVSPHFLGESGFTLGFFLNLLPATLVLKFSHKSIKGILLPILGIFITLFVFFSGYAIMTENYGPMVFANLEDPKATYKILSNKSIINVKGARSGYFSAVFTSKVDLSPFIDKEVKLTGDRVCQGLRINTVTEVK